MALKIPLGWDVKMAAEQSEPPPRGRAIVVGANYWCFHPIGGYNTYQGQSASEFLEDSRRTVQAMVKWATGLTTGANILIMGEPEGGDIGAYGVPFREGLEYYGHTYTMTGVDVVDWEGHEPLDYDLLCGSGNINSGASYHGFTAAQDKLDYLLSNGGRVIWNGSYQDFWPPYGLGGDDTGHVGHNEPGIQVHIGPKGPNTWNGQRPFSCERFGDPGAGGSWGTNLFALAMHTTGYVTETALSRPGAREVYRCAAQEVGNHSGSIMGVIGLYSSDGVMD